MRRAGPVFLASQLVLVLAGSHIVASTSSVAPVPGRALSAESAPSPVLGPATELAAAAVPKGLPKPFSDGAWLASVACRGASQCAAFGAFDEGGGSLGMGARFGGGRWVVNATPLSGLTPPARATAQAVVPGPIACPPTGSCAAVGTYTSARGGTWGLIETVDLSGPASHAWSTRSASLAGLAPRPAADPEVQLSQVECLAAGQCVALGSYEDRSLVAHDFFEVESGRTWYPVQAPSPGSGRPEGGAGVHLDALACAARPSRSCTAVGYYQGTGGRRTGVAVTGWGRSWKATNLAASALEPKAGLQPEVDLAAVSCPASSRCMAAGTYVNSSGAVTGLFASGTAGSWALSSLPSAGLVPPPAGLVGPAPAAISCPTVTFCAIVGTYRDLYGYVEPFADTGQEGRWQEQALPEYAFSPPGSPKAVFALSSVDCPVARQCVASGYYGAAANEAFGAVEVLGQDIWTGTTAPLGGLDPQAGAFPGSQLTGLDCPSVAFCALVGSYSGVTGVPHGLVETTEGEKATAG